MARKSKKWRLKQAQTIGASVASTVMGENKYKPTLPELYDRMRAAICDRKAPPEIPVNDDMRRGIIGEPIAVRMLRERYEGVKRHDQNAFMYDESHKRHVLPDAWVGTTPVEIKCPRPAGITRVNVEGLRHAAPHWWWQCQHALLVIPFEFVRFVMLDVVSMSLHVQDIVRVPEAQGLLLEAEDEFYRNVIQGKRPADPSTEIVEARNEIIEADAEDLPSKILADPEAFELAHALRRLRQATDQVEVAESAVKARLQALSGDADIIVVPGIMRAYHRPQKGRKILDTQKVFERFPILKDDDEFWRESRPSRPWRLYFEEE